MEPEMCFWVRGEAGECGSRSGGSSCGEDHSTGRGDGARTATAYTSIMMRTHTHTHVRIAHLHVHHQHQAAQPQGSDTIQSIAHTRSGTARHKHTTQQSRDHSTSTLISLHHRSAVPAYDPKV
eukprot:3185820-Rhodomonas_salina.1